MKRRGRRDLENVQARALKLAAMGRISDEDAHEIRANCRRALLVIRDMREYDRKGELISGQEA
jgi:hypothetical protein